MGPVAPTVPVMIFILLGIGIGAALALASHPLLWLLHPIDVATAQLVAQAHRFIAWGLTQAGVHAHGTGGQVVTIVLAVMVPGLVCLGLAFAARAVQSTRRLAAGLLLIAAIASFAVLPAGESVLLVLVALVASSALALATGALLVTPVVTVATVLGVRTAAVVARGKSADVLTGAKTLAHIGGLDAGMWRLSLAVVALAPVVGAAQVLLRDR